MSINFKTLPNAVKVLVDIFSQMVSAELYLVGGCVRDMLLGNQPKDYDFCTNLTPKQMQQLAKDFSELECRGVKYRIATIPTGEQYGTITFRLEEVVDGSAMGPPFLAEVTTYRADGTYSDGRRPDTAFFSTNIQDDLSRRDFTVNAIALNMLSNVNDYVDPFNGIKDIESKVIKTVGDPVERFTEDGLRILRAIRFRFKLGFTFDAATYKAIMSNWQLLEHISQERITSEFLQILTYGHLDSTEDCYLMDALIKQILPEAYIENIYDCNWWEYKTLFEFPDIETKLAFLLKNSNTDILDLCYKLKLSNKMSKDIVEAIYCKNALEEFGHTEYVVRKLVSEWGKNNVLRGFYLYDEIYNLTPSEWSWAKDTIQQTDQEYIHISDLKLTGDDLVTLGFTGRAIGEALRYLLDEVLRDQTANTKQNLVRLLERRYISPNCQKES